MSLPNSTEDYIKELALNIKASHPITVVYTEDLLDTLALTKQAVPLVRQKTDKIFYWNARNRWSDISSKDKSLAELIANPTLVQLDNDQSKTPIALCFSSPEKLKCRSPVFVISLLSSQFKNENIGILQELRDFDYLVRNGVNDSYRIVILANRSFEIPVDYENMFGVITHKTPTREELEKLYDEDFMKDYIERVLKPMFDGDPNAVEKEFKALKTYCVNTLAGLTARQVRLILYKAVSHSVEKVNASVVKSVDFDKFKEFIYTKKFEEVSKTDVIELLKPLSMKQVGGLTELKGWLEERAWAFTPAAKKLNVERPKGMLLIGPPGTGKTHVAKATASILDFPCLKFNASSIFNKYVGESEQRMDSVLRTIEATAPCVVFIDEIDKVFSSQAGGNSAGDSGTTSRVMGKLLSWMQDTTAEVFVILTANRIQNIPSEILRKGRIDEIWCVTFPTRQERQEIINIHLGNRGYSLKSFDKVLDATEEYSSSELEHIVKESILKAGKAGKKLDENFMLAEVTKIVPSSKAFAVDIARMKEWAHTHARFASLPEVTQVTTDKTTEL